MPSQNKAIMNKATNISRRKFLGKSCAAVGYTTLFSSLINLKAFAAAALDNSSLQAGDYKALVFVMLGGGNDSYNMLIPRGTAEYNEYAITRSNLAIDQSSILPINPITTDGRLFGLHPNMSDIQQLFENNKLAFLSNVGTLVEPTTKIAFQNSTVQKPLGLFSHADQQQQWHTGRSHERTNIGWGGRIADLIQSMNSNENISMNISLEGINVFQYGQEVIPYVINGEGSIGIRDYDATDPFSLLRTSALNSMMDRDYQDIYKNTYINTIKTSNDSSIEFQNAIDAIPEFTSSYPDDYFSEQLRMVAKTIAARETLGFSRQIFYVQLNGWDHHDELLINQGNLLTRLNAGLKYFNDVIEELGISDEVTTFSISDFGRTLTSNGNGTDHAWGGNVMMMGGSVIGKDMYGNYPSLALDSNLDLGDGVLIPTTATDMYFAELAQWFGVSNNDINMIFPNLSNFYDTNSGVPPIGFMNI
jgi:uncharacterized protein (DUF1501 family)